MQALTHHSNGPPGAQPPARILMHVKRTSGLGTFIADLLEREGNTWSAEGVWLYPSGRRSDPPTRYTWPTHVVLEIRHDWEPSS